MNKIFSLLSQHTSFYKKSGCLKNITNNVVNASHAINTQNVANISHAFPLFSFFGIVTYALVSSYYFQSYINT